MVIQGQVVSYQGNVEVAKKDGGSYPGFRLIYTDANGQVKTIEKHINSLKFNKPLANALASLQPGDAISIVQEKNGAFWELKSVTKGGDAPPAALAAQDKPKAASGGFTPPPVRDFETRQERDRKQVLIVRQSSLAQAVVVNPKGKTQDILSQAEEFTEWVLNGSKKDDRSVATPSDDFMDDIPL